MAAVIGRIVAEAGTRKDRVPQVSSLSFHLRETLGLKLADGKKYNQSRNPMKQKTRNNTINQNQKLIP
jgi:hypothetical protein